MKNVRTYSKRLLCILLVCLCTMSTLTTSYAATKKDVTKTFADKDKVKKLVTNFNDWVGYQYLYNSENSKNKTIKLTNKTMLSIVGMNMSSPTSKKLKAKTKKLFGKSPAISNLATYKDTTEMSDANEFAGLLKDGSIITLVGDWGCAYPKISVSKIVKVNSTTYEVTAKTNYIDEPEDTTKLIGTTVFTIKKNKDATYGYYVTGIKLKAKVTK